MKVEQRRYQIVITGMEREAYWREPDRLPVR